MACLEVHHQGTMAGMVDVVCRWEGLGPETAAMYMGVMGLQGGVWGHVISSMLSTIAFTSGHASDPNLEQPK